MKSYKTVISMPTKIGVNELLNKTHFILKERFCCQYSMNVCFCNNIILCAYHSHRPACGHSILKPQGLISFRFNHTAAI